MDKDYLFKRVAGLISNAYDLETRLTKGVNLSVTNLQFTILKILYFSEIKNISSLSECLDINLPNCSREVKKLTLSGYLEKRPSEVDKRNRDIYLTEKAYSLIEKIMLETKENYFRNKSNISEDVIKSCIESIDLLEKEIFN